MAQYCHGADLPSLGPASGTQPQLGGLGLLLSEDRCQSAPGFPLFLFSILMGKL